MGAGVSDSDGLNRALFLREIVILSGARSAQSKDLLFASMLKESCGSFHSDPVGMTTGNVTPPSMYPQAESC